MKAKLIENPITVESLIKERIHIRENRPMYTDILGKDFKEFLFRKGFPSQRIENPQKEENKNGRNN